MSSYALEVITEQAPVFIREPQKGIYEVVLSEWCLMPLRIKKRRMLTDQWVLTFDYLCSTFISHISVMVHNREVLARNITLLNGQWQTFSIDLTAYKELLERYILTLKPIIQIILAPVVASEAVSFKIKNIRLRSRTVDEQKKAEIQQAYKNRSVSGVIGMKSYLYDSVFPNAIDHVQARENEILIQGEVVFNPALPVFLCELPIYKDFTVNNLELIEEVNPESGRFKVVISRMIEQQGRMYDRVYSRWFLMYRDQDKRYICSHGHYVNQTSTGHLFPQLQLKTRKGLGDFKYNHLYTDLKDLGISYVSCNIRLNNFLRLDPDVGRIPFEYNKKTYYADQRKIEKYDRTIRCAAEHGIDVSLIILVYPELWSRDPNVGRMLEHPEYERDGAYTMPNLTNVDSVNLYAAALDFLAARYNRPDGKYGRVHRWIVHNEVNSGRVWTNAGDKTLVAYMDIYIKSMRMIYYTARKYDANAEVLISLDHCWNEKYVEPNCFSGAKVMQVLMDYCKTEGDFKWGIAIHPYPEHLLDPKAWLDKKATHFTDTPYITFKNLEVLDAWIKTSATSYEGKKRTLLLSEQNPNSFDYTELALQEQAAGLAYAWKKVEACSGIDAYMGHSWIDARFEGGLRTGFRKYPDDPDDPYGAKPSWFVFRDAGPECEEKAFEFAKEIICIKDWNEIIESVRPAEPKQSKKRTESKLSSDE